MTYLTETSRLTRIAIPVWAWPILVSLTVGVLWIGFGPLAVVAGLGGAGLMAVALSSYAWTLGIVLVGRTCLDLFYDQNVYLGSVRISAASVFGLVIVGLIVVTHLVSRSGIPVSDGVKAFSLLILGSLLGTITAYARFGSTGNMAFRELVRLAVLLIWYVFLYERSRSTGNPRPFLRAVVLASVAPIAVCYWHYFRGIGIATEGVNRIYSTFVDPNAFGFYLVFLVMFCFAWIAEKGGTLPWLLLAGALISLLLTYSRGAWITLATAVPFFWLRDRRRRGLLILAVGVLIFLTFPILRARLGGIDYADLMMETRTGITSNSFSFRMVIWQNLLDLWKEHPWIGWGLESTVIVNPVRAMSNGAGAAAHNDAVRYLVEGGLLGLAFYLYFLYVLGRNLYRRSLQLVGHPLEHYATAGLAIYVGFILQSLTVSEPLHQTIFLFYFLGLAAVLDGCAESQVTVAGEADATPWGAK